MVYSREGEDNSRVAGSEIHQGGKGFCWIHGVLSNIHLSLFDYCGADFRVVQEGCQV